MHAVAPISTVLAAGFPALMDAIAVCVPHPAVHCCTPGNKDMHLMQAKSLSLELCRA